MFLFEYFGFSGSRDQEFDVLRGCPIKDVNVTRQLSASEGYPEGLTVVGYPHFPVLLGRGIWVQHLRAPNLIKLQS